MVDIRIFRRLSPVDRDAQLRFRTNETMYIKTSSVSGV